MIADSNNEERRGGEQRWLLSYADLVTLLFSLFVVLFASNYAARTRTGEISTGIRQAFGDGSHAHAPGPAKQGGNNALEALKGQLNQRLNKTILDGSTEIQLESRGLVIHLKDVSFFRPGDSELRADAFETVDQIAQVIAPLPNIILVEGHSDTTAIHTARFQDNWELSSARAVSMVRYLNRMYGIAEPRLSAAAYSGTRPLSDNESEEGRARNRRVDIVILSP